MSRIVTVSGRSRDLPDDLEHRRVAGLDPEGRIVVDDFDARNRPADQPEGALGAPFLFGLTLCCNASDKGVEDGVVCRGCYGYDEVGAYLFREPDGSFPGLDPVASIEDDYDPTPCCPDPGCPGRNGQDCTFPGYAANH